MSTKFRVATAGSLFLGIGMIIGSAQSGPPATASGTIKGKGFLNIGGTAIADLTGAATYPDNPDVVFYYPYFEWNGTGDINTPANNAMGDNYGAVMQGYFYAPSQGDYVFFLSADDNANLYLSTDSNPANKKLIAQEAGWSNPRNWDTIGGGSTIEAKNSSSFTGTEWPTKGGGGGAAITLQANQAYYIEAQMKEGGGGDNLAVAVQDPKSAIDATLPIPGKYLSPYAPATAPKVLSQPKDTAVLAGFDAAFSVGAEVPPGATGVTYKWTKNGTDIPDSNSSQLTLKAAAADNGAKIKAFVTSSAGNVESSEATLSVATLANEFTPGVVKFEAYKDITGTAVDLLTSDPKYPASPDDVRLLGSISSPNGYAENYGARVSGFIIPPESGSYRFFVYSDDASQLWLSTDDKEANAVMIAEETGCCNNFTEPDSPRTSEPISLTAGKKYAFYGLLKEGGGGDYLQVAVRKEGDKTPSTSLTPINSSWIGANAKPSLGTPVITTQPVGNPALLQGRSITLTAEGKVTPESFNFPIAWQWQKDGQNIAGAVANSLTFDNVTTANSGTYRVVATAPSGITANSSDAVVTVIADAQAPRVTRVSAGSLEAVTVSFDEPVDKATAETASNYALSGGVTVKSAVLSESKTAVLLGTSALTVNSPYTLTVGGIKDPYGNAVPAGTQVNFTAKVVTYADIILADNPIAFYRFEETSGASTKNLGTFGSKGDGLYMVGNGPDDSVPGTAVVGEGPRPPAFLGFASGNNAAKFAGPDAQQWVDTQNQFLNNLPAFSLEYWVKPANRATDPTTFGNRIGIVGQNDAIEYGFINPTTVQIWSSGGGSLDTTYSFADGEWHHVATIADGKNIKNYYDGKLVGTGGSTSSNYGSSAFNVHIGGGGVYDGTGNFFTGQFDEVAIFAKAIPADRIAAHYKAGKEGGQLPDEPASGISGIKLSGGQVTITWASGTLNSATSVAGPFAPVAGATSPYSVPPTGAATFYIVK